MNRCPASKAVPTWPVTSAKSPATVPGRARGWWMWERAFPGSVNQVAQVRSAVRIVLDGCPAADDVVQILSEVAANACQHSSSGKPGGKFIVRLQHSPGACVLGEVEDEGGPWDGDLKTSARDRSGLSLVLALASGCGVELRPGEHHAVWFHLPCQPEYPGEAGR
jgi:serine/threonine-protein kinase RsbW